MKQNNVELIELDADNWYDFCALEVDDDQARFMESNAISIAQSKFEPTLKPYGITCNGMAVGFLMFNTEKEELDGYWIFRIMLDKHHQQKGIGKKATQLMLDEMSKLPDAKRIVVGYHPENTGAHRLYASLGFKDNGDRFGKEMAVVKEL